MDERHLATLVREYQSSLHPRLIQELAFYQQLPTIDASIEYAALAKLPNGKRHPHQRRLKRYVLDAVWQSLLANRHQLEQSRSFEDVIQLVRGCAVPGFGELAIYDTALRLAVRLSKLPTAVYLHAGTRKGAAALGLKVNREAIPMKELPGPLQKLDPDDAENFLCIYKDRLAKPGLADEQAPHGCTPQISSCVDVKEIQDGCTPRLRGCVDVEEIQTPAPHPCSPGLE